MSDDELSMPIIEYKGKYLTGEDVVEGMHMLGIQKGDTICVHSQIFSLGRAVIAKKDFLAYMVNLLQYVVGESGTLLMPTFSYSFCKNEIYDIEQSRSDVGILTEYFRKLPGVVRTSHPIFSFAIWGKRKKEFLDLPITSFTSDSVYGNLCKNNDKLVLLGAPLGYTFYYLAEEYVGVTHRFFKDFSGIVKHGEDTKKISVPYYVRKLDRRSTESERKINNFLFEKGLQRSISIGHGSITVAEMQPVFYALVEKLKENESFFLREDEKVL